MDKDQAARQGDDPLAYMTSGHPIPNLFESQMSMLGRMGRGATPRLRLLARVFAMLALFPFPVALVMGVADLIPR